MPCGKTGLAAPVTNDNLLQFELIPEMEKVEKVVPVFLAFLLLASYECPECSAV